MNSFVHMMRQLGPVRLATMGLVAVGLIGFFLFMTARLTTPEMSLLYSELAVEDSGAIANRLDAQAIPYEVRGGGTQIYVPGDQVGRLRLSMASEGLPNGGSVGYELFDNSDTLGTTSFVQRINHARALEGELARTIASIQQVQSARVHLVLPRREVFSRDHQEPSASIILKLRGSALQQSQVLAIQHLVATAVPNLQPSSISVVDSSGRLLARGGDDGQDTLSPATSDEARRSYESRLAKTVEKLIERSVGIGAVRAEVSAEIDFDRVTTSDEVYDPDGQVVRSTQTVEQADNNSETDPNSVSVANNVPNADVIEGGQGNLSSSASRRVEETVNFEISRKVTTLVRETGVVRRLSVAVLVDGTVDAEGEYTPRTPEELQQYEALVKSAIGFDEERGDKVEVVNLPFAPVDFEETEIVAPSLFGLTKADLFRVAEMLVLGIVAVLVLLLVVRPLISRAFESAAEATANMNMLTGGNAGQLAGPMDDPGNYTGVESEQEDGEFVGIDVASVDGRVKQSSLNQVNEIVQRHPEETVSILRQWMYQET